MSTKLEFHLYPKGRSAAEPDLMPSVKDGDGVTVLFTSEKRKTTEASVVNLGDSPNSNNGDPLRTAFAKINNFIEASYWTNESINKKFNDIDSEFREGIFIYTDSDERVNLSLLDNSKLYFRGTPNQIEMNITHSNSSNNPHDFDSEISLNFQLTEQVDISTLRVFENAQFDSDVNVKGRMFVDSDVVLSADLRVDSDVIIKGTLSVGQEAHFYDDVHFHDGIQFDSDIVTNGTVRTDSIQGQATNNVLIDDHFQVKGGAVFDSDVLVSKRLTVSKESYFLDDVIFYDNAQFDSDIVVNGTVKVDVIQGQAADTVTVDDKFVVRGSARFDSDVNIGGGITLTGSMSVNDLTVTGNLVVRDKVTFDSDIKVRGAVLTDVVKGETGNTVTVDDKLRVRGGATFDSEILVLGISRMDAIKGAAGDTVEIDDKLTVFGHATFDSDVTVNGQLTNQKEVFFLDDVRFYDNAQFDSDISVAGGATFGREVVFNDDVHFKDGVLLDSDLVVTGDVTINGQLLVKQEVVFEDDVRFNDNAKFDSDVIIKGQLTVDMEATFNDDAFFYDNAYFDSDVMIVGNLTVNGTTTAVNSQNLEVKDNLIVLNYNQTTPFNDVGLIFTRYDSDNVDATNFNVALVWDELTDQFIFAQTQSSGILPNPTLTQQYVHIGQTVEFFDSDNNARMVWDKSHARLSILNQDGTEMFAIDADSGQIEGNGTIDAGLF